MTRPVRTAARRRAARIAVPRRVLPILVALSALCLAGCGGGQSTLDPVSEPARQIEDLWWAMFWIAAVVFAGTVGLLALSWLLRRRKGIPIVGDRDGVLNALVVAFGIVIPIVVLIGVFVVGNVVVIDETAAPDPASTPITIEVTGKQWWWEIRYPGSSRAITANEIHIPVRTRVNLVGTSADVIHSFWVPQLNRKIDLFPGKVNRVLLYTDRPGRYRGQCAEFCGQQHSKMALAVFADEPEEYRRWLAHMASPRPEPDTPSERAGERVFLENQCASCHQIRGTPARGKVGPDLTHLQSRETLAALTIPNRRAYLERWVRNPQQVKPGNRMPALELSGPELQVLLDYLESLR